MKFNKLFLILAAAAVGSFGVHAQISVGPGGAGPLTFDEFPVLPATEWATATIGGTANTTYGNAASVAAGVQGVTAASINTVLPRVTALGTAAQARHHTNPAAAYLFTQVTGSGATLLKATLRNNTGGQISHLDVTYDFGVPVAGASESSPGHVAMFSTNGQIGSWQPIAAFTGLNAAANLTATLFVGVWEPNTDIYLVWADDNAETGTEGSYSIDNFTVGNLVSTNVVVPLSVALTAPTNNAAAVTPGVLTATATTAGTVPATSVAFYANGVHIGTDTTAPYSATVTNPAAGVYAVQAFATNGVDPDAASAVATLYVRNENASLTATPYTQDFSGMIGAEETITPEGWYVTQALPATTLRVVVDNGSLAPSGNYFGLNYGTTSDADRSIGTAPTGGDRNTVLRLRNNTSSNIVSFTVKYDGETWRTHNSATTNEYLTNFVSFDNGASWVLTGADYINPVPGVNPAVALDGNNPANRVADITSGTITPPTPVSPGSVILVRWQNFNEGGTDGGMSVDNFSFDVTEWSQYSLTVAITSPTDGANVEALCPPSLTVNANASGLTTNVAFQLDGGAAVNDTTAPFSATFTAGLSVGPHTITATAKDSLGNTASHTINVTIIANQAPAITFTNTYSGANTGLTFLVGSPVTAQFAVTDANLTLMEFLVNDVVILSTNVAFTTLTVGDVLVPGSVLKVRATDSCANVSEASRTLIVTNPPVIVVVSNGSNWRYFNSNTAPPNDAEGDQWFETDFDDSAWLSGFAELGGGDAVLPPVAATVPERTLLDIGPAANRHRAAYFRHTFNTASPVSSLSVRSMHDDGAVVYLNGTIVATFNMPIQASYAYGDLALGAVAGDGSTYYVSNITASTVAGANTLAVEVHQNAADSSDIGFDLMLWSVGGPPLTIVINGSNYEVSWSDPSGTYILQESSDVGSPLNWADVPSPTNPLIRPLTTPSPKFYRLRSP